MLRILLVADTADPEAGLVARGLRDAGREVVQVAATSVAAVAAVAVQEDVDAVRVEASLRDDVRRALEAAGAPDVDVAALDDPVTST